MHRITRFSEKRYSSNSIHERQRSKLDQNALDLSSFSDDDLRLYLNNARHGDVMACYTLYARKFHMIKDPASFRLHHKETLLACYAAEGDPLCVAVQASLADLLDGSVRDSVLEKLTIPEEIVRRSMTKKRYDELCRHYSKFLPEPSASDKETLPVQAPTQAPVVL